MSLFQVAAVCFALLMLYLVTIERKKKRLGPFETLMWYILWFAFIALALFPGILLGVVGLIHFSRVFDLLIVMAFMVTTTLVILTYFRYKEVKLKIEELSRQIALTNPVK